MPVTEFNDDKPAIDYIRKRGYASYSSLKNVRDCLIPSVYKSTALNFGKELHSRDLEKKRTCTLSKEEEIKLKGMLAVLGSSKMVQQLKQGSKFEQEFKEPLYGLMVLGYIDIDGKSISDYKTCWHNNSKKFISEQDFLHAALYLAVRKRRDLYYIGICKEVPHTLMIHNVQHYPARIKAAQVELKNLITYTKLKLDGKIKSNYIYKTWLHTL